MHLYALVVPLKTIPDFRPYDNGQNLHPFSDQNGSKTIPFGAAHTYIADIGEYSYRAFVTKFTKSLN